MNSRQQFGFTLWELLVTLLVAGILFGIGVPSFRDFQRNSALIAVGNQLVTGLLRARTEAVKRQVPVTLCASPDPDAAAPVCSPSGAGTNGGFIVWVDENGNLDGNGSPIINDATDGNAVVNPNELILMRSAAPPTAAPVGTLNTFATSGYVSYGSNGWARQATGVAFPSAIWVLFCDDRGNHSNGALSTARAVRIEASGRGGVIQTAADVSIALAAIAASVNGAAASCPAS